MVFRHIAQSFCHRRTRRSSTKYIINELPKTFSDQVYPQIPFLTRSKKYNIKIPQQFGNNPAGQLRGLARTVTELFRDERIVVNYNKAAEIRPQVERLIVEAIRNGDRHRPTMALADFWLLDKSLIHKLFKELVPRYSNYSSAFTALHMLGKNYALWGRTMTELKSDKRFYYKMGEVVLELRGNNLPPIIRPKLNRSELLTNILLDSVRNTRPEL